MDGDLTSYFLTQGVLGVAVAVLGLVIRSLYGKTERLEKEKSDLAEARRLDDKDMIEKITAIIQENTQSNRILAEKIEVAKSIDRKRQ